MSARETLKSESSGVYRTPADVAGLECRALASDAAWIEVELTDVRDKPQLLRAFADAFAFPPSFGQNWDALADSVQDLSWLPGAGYVLRLRNTQPARRALGAEWDTLVEILRESAAYWKGRGKPFVALVDGCAELPEWK